ncbi:PE domain-containing protein [Pseudonocardia spinosispora]|uniref:PE domain-containing protein n=1 Tax=Pseudonocardia spinosispora TaxID=103441 RepID=UPI00048FD4A3|nr:PE domain-containing protein [Pseudonocardia spinosispora]
MASTVIAGMTVTPENVLQLHNVFQSEVAALRSKTVFTLNFKVGKAAEDPVSPRAADGFNTKIDSYKRRVQDYVDELDATARALADAAKRYGHSEEEIVASFRKFSPGYQQRNGLAGSVQR